MSEEKKNPKKGNSLNPTGIAIGLCLGVALGTVFDDFAIGMCLGMAFGVSLAMVLGRESKEEKETKE